MPISMYKVSAPTFIQILTALSGTLDKAAAQAEAKKLDPAFLLGMRLYGDMFPLARQVRAAADHGVNCCARLAGVQPPSLPTAETSFADLKERLAQAVAFIKTLKPEQIDGSEEKQITFKAGPNERTLSGQALLLTFHLPNFYFHATTAYDILRHCGIEIGKRDFMGTPVKP